MSVNSVIEYAAKCYGFVVKNITPINSGSNRVFKFQKDDQNFYLRISTREYNYIMAEIDWVTFLKDSIKVPVLLISNNDKSVEIFKEDEKTYVLCAFYELAGLFWDKNDRTKWNETVFYNWGKAIGKMHQMTKEYRPRDGSAKRLSFEENLMSLEIYKSIPSVYEKMEQLQIEISTLPKDIDSYGLIHSDMHQQNILIDCNEISVLDFDDCQYGFFSQDIGIALYHAIWWGLPDNDLEKNDFALKIIRNFMRGYNSQNHLSEFWLRKILMFMKYRQIDALSWFLAYFKPDNFDVSVYVDIFKIDYNFRENIDFIKNDIFYENCKLNECDFMNI